MLDTILQYITKERHSHFDLTWLLLSFYCFVQGMFTLGLILYFGGVLLSVALITIAGRDAKWHRLAKLGYKVEAIKEHRRVYGSSLRDALDAVEAYMGLPKRTYKL